MSQIMEVGILEPCGFSHSPPCCVNAFDGSAVDPTEDEVERDLLDLFPVAHPFLMLPPCNQGLPCARHQETGPTGSVLLWKFVVNNAFLLLGMLVYNLLKGVGRDTVFARAGAEGGDASSECGGWVRHGPNGELCP